MNDGQYKIVRHDIHTADQDYAHQHEAEKEKDKYLEEYRSELRGLNTAMAHGADHPFKTFLQTKNNMRIDYTIISDLLIPCQQAVFAMHDLAVDLKYMRITTLEKRRRRKKGEAERNGPYSGKTDKRTAREMTKMAKNPASCDICWGSNKN